MMRQLIDKKKKYIFYLLIFLSVSSINNLSFVKSKSLFLKINSIEVKGLVKHLNIEIKKKTSFLMNKSIFFIDEQNLKNELSNYNYLNDYKISKIYPSKIIIDLNQTKILASTIKQNKKYFIGRNGKLINSKKIELKNYVPSIIGIFDNNDFIFLYKIIMEENFNYNDIEYFYYFENGRWNITTKNNIIIKLPKSNVRSALIKAKNIIISDILNDNNVIDLRIKNQIILSNE